VVLAGARPGDTTLFLPGNEGMRARGMRRVQGHHGPAPGEVRIERNRFHGGTLRLESRGDR
jgi:hypothetical protein